MVMSVMRLTLNPRRRPLRALAGILVVLFVLLAGLAASPALHQAIHPDANSSSHTCAISLLAQGHLESPVGSTFLCLAPASVNYATPIHISVFGIAVELLPPGRAPPATLS